MESGSEKATQKIERPVGERNTDRLFPFKTVDSLMAIASADVLVGDNYSLSGKLSRFHTVGS